MLKQVLALCNKEKTKKGTTLHRRLLLFFIFVSVSLILAFALLLSMFGINGKEQKLIQNHLTTELSIISDKIDGDFGRIALGGISIAEDIAEKSDNFFEENGIKPNELSDHPNLIEPLLSENMQTLLNTVNNRICGGVFIMLDASVNSGSEYSKAGVFLKKTQPTVTDSLGVRVHYLRGPSNLARDNGIMLLGQWKMEFDTEGQDFFANVVETARANPDLPLSRLYYWTGRTKLKENSEAGFLLCVPLRSEDGTVFGVCGIEVSDRLFKSLYTPEGGSYESIFTVMAPNCDIGLCTSKGIIAGNYYLTGNHWENDLSLNGTHDGFLHYDNGEEIFGGKKEILHLYSAGSPYQEESWSVAVLMPKDILHSAVTGNIKQFIYIVVILLVVSVAISYFISHRYLHPVNKALHSIKNTPHDERGATPYSEINELFEFLAAQAREHKETVGQLHNEKTELQAQYDKSQAELASERLAKADPEDFEMFMDSLKTLTTKERTIFELYLEGKKSKEIMEITEINQNTLKYHNKNIYSKLGISSRKQLLEFASLMKHAKKKSD